MGYDEAVLAVSAGLDGFDGRFTRQGGYVCTFKRCAAGLLGGLGLVVVGVGVTVGPGGSQAARMNSTAAANVSRRKCFRSVKLPFPHGGGGGGTSVCVIKLTPYASVNAAKGASIVIIIARLHDGAPAQRAASVRPGADWRGRDRAGKGGKHLLRTGIRVQNPLRMKGNPSLVDFVHVGPGLTAVGGFPHVVE